MSSPRVGIVMGSDSDWPIMEAAAQALAEFDIGYEVKVSSAHRMPHATLEYGQTAAARGLQVIIAGAGGAAHLPGVLAAVTALPVIGVPVPLKHSTDSTRCSRSCRCPLACRWRRSESEPRAMPGCSPSAFLVQLTKRCGRASGRSRAISRSRSGEGCCAAEVIAGS